jgi:hypothetical protein
VHCFEQFAVVRAFAFHSTHMSAPQAAKACRRAEYVVYSIVHSVQEHNVHSKER